MKFEYIKEDFEKWCESVGGEFREWAKTSVSCTFYSNPLRVDTIDLHKDEIYIKPMFEKVFNRYTDRDVLIHLNSTLLEHSEIERFEGFSDGFIIGGSFEVKEILIGDGIDKLIVEVF